jgi:hypothetical protein
MKVLTVIVIGFGVFAYDLSFNDAQIIHWLGSVLGFS